MGAGVIEALEDIRKVLLEGGAHKTWDQTLTKVIHRESFDGKFSKGVLIPLVLGEGLTRGKDFHVHYQEGGEEGEVVSALKKGSSISETPPKKRRGKDHE